MPFYFTLTPIAEKKDQLTTTKTVLQAGATIGTIILSTILIGSLS
jgi:hypothetical protein